jgi:hypothetical protein
LHLGLRLYLGLRLKARLLLHLAWGLRWRGLLHLGPLLEAGLWLHLRLWLYPRRRWCLGRLPARLNPGHTRLSRSKALRLLRSVSLLLSLWLLHRSPLLLLNLDRGASDGRRRSRGRRSLLPVSGSLPWSNDGWRGLFMPAPGPWLGLACLNPFPWNHSLG